jgi:ubiquinone/menaquinone biosynthesis C-methylase UbiE
LAKPLHGQVNPLDDIARLRDEYADRKRRFSDSDVYSWLNTANLFTIQQRQRAVLAALKKHGVTNLADLQILEMGCGGGGVLAEFLGFGVPLYHLYGVDLLSDRLTEAHHRLPASSFANADGQSLPFPSQSFDLIMQFTAISSILDSDMRRNICMDMIRVAKPGGLILSYDFWLNPTNPQTRGVRPSEIRRLFPGCRFEFQRITLAPPIARRSVPVSWLFSAFLEKLSVFNSHYLVAIQPA